MTEAEKIALSEPLAEIFMSMEDDLLRAIAKQIAEGGEINASSEWRLLKLAQEGALTAEAVRIITKYLGSQDEELTRVIAAAALGVIDTLEPAFQQCALDGFVSDASEIPMSAMSAKIISTYRKQAATDLNLVNTVMMYKTGSRYKELVNKIYDEANRQDYLNILGKHTASVVTGAEARQKAVSSCIREFADKGIPAFVDKAGREWSPEAYINMDIRTTVSNTANAAQDAVCDRYGVDLIEFSSHLGARPKCAHDQGKIFSRSNQSGIAHDGNGREIRYEPLSSTSYGQPDGILGINCRHQKYPFVDGVNFQTYFPYDEAENAQRYKEFQTQRAMERDIRKKKRECMMLEETGDTEALKAARADLRQSKKAYNAYSDEHGLRTREDRLRVERSSGKGAADQSSAKPVLPGGSGGHAVEIGVWGSDNGGNGKIYRDTGLTNGGGNEQSVTSKATQTENEASTSLTKAENGDKLKTVPGNTPKNNSTSKSQHGRGARTLNASNLKDSHVHKIGNIDFNDKKAVTEYMEKFENKFAHKDKEYCLVITPNGEIYVARGGAAEIDTDKIFGDKMKGSWNTHTHPPDQTEYSFSTRDVSGAVLDGTAVMRASDTKYCYEIRFNGKTFTEDELADAIGTAEILKYDSFDAKGYTMADYVDKYEHSIIEDICKMLGVEYKRWEKS